ncbi:3'-phosphoadenosine 5'-phosphosulfate sulfotransferase (PAPS reductase)/FAD synthetase [Methylobacterium sp. BE186]|uniref:phosphoadenosine phosphosulfate reductase family protein n=1 Tax=Methylobacterium sp. BE186 TaxID=2817715 RepID=UPI0028610624|nr:phosphoadenosine phosphosulfate reductase family protein [Methylobacterium sp. BE186]MDR7037381.1 3'-phosphoadenosine 5'-phosphosulfate sulfotransferase (PAPS reductase)/FAD synthetase [Methylobacterium sp. BE186]
MNPYFIQGPALISFSGGRTSGYMLHQILSAHDGRLPDDVVVAFANTGQEREETLRFVRDCGVRWGVEIAWIEWRPMPQRFEVVGYRSAARNGEPFEGLIALRGRLPNPLQRFCSRELKVEPIKAFCRSLGWERWANVIGLRHDEGMRVLKKLAENEKSGHRWKSAMPLAKAKVTKRDVMEFWAAQPFDLALKGHEGNCDLCFLKSRGSLEAIIRDDPSRAHWWMKQEAGGKRFERARSYAEMAAHVAASPTLFDDPDDEFDAECGLTCASELEEAA